LPRDPLPAPIGGSPGNAPDVGLIRQLFAEIGRLHAPTAAAAAVNQPPVSATERELPVNPGEPAAAEVAKSLQVTFPLGLWLSAVAAGVITAWISNTPRGQGMACMVGGVSGILFITAVAQLSRWTSTRGAKRYAGAFAARRSAMDQQIATLEAVERAAADVWSRQAAVGPRIERLRAAAAELAASDQRDLANIHANAAQRFRDRWRHEQLDNFLIAAATISGIGLERKRVLASHGIETAADVNRADVRSVPRFGPKLTDALIDWRDECLRAVSKRPVPAMPSGFVEALHREHVARLAKAAESVAAEYRAIKGLVHENEFAARHHAIAVAGARVAFRKARQDALRICA
jgi:DNA-binding helix-hairpin-helix protein with protein kinase domain